jgi:hypothetical protein
VGISSHLGERELRSDLAFISWGSAPRMMVFPLVLAQGFGLSMCDPVRSIAFEWRMIPILLRRGRSAVWGLSDACLFGYGLEVPTLMSKSLLCEYVQMLSWYDRRRVIHRRWGAMVARIWKHGAHAGFERSMPEDTVNEAGRVATLRAALPHLPHPHPAAPRLRGGHPPPG